MFYKIILYQISIKVNSNKHLLSIICMNCFGLPSVEYGHNLVPEPPHIIIGIILSEFIFHQITLFLYFTLITYEEFENI